MKAFPGDFYDFIHIDGQQDGDGTYHDLEMALEKGRYILVDGYFWTDENMLSSTYFLKKYEKFIEYSIVIPGYAGDLLIKTRECARNMLGCQPKDYLGLKNSFSSEYYFNICDGYEEFLRSNGKELNTKYSAIFALVNPKREENILDIGCGRGELAFALSQTGANVIGLDYSNHSIEIAKKTYSEYIGQNLNFINADISEYYPEIKFDRVIASDVVEHIEPDALDKIINKVSSMLKDDGYFVVHTAPNLLNYKYEYSEKRILAKQAGTYIPANPRTYYEDLMHINEQTPAKLNRSLKKHFRYTLTWVGCLPKLIGSLEGSYDKDYYIKTNSIFSIASNKEIIKSDIIDMISQQALSEKDVNIYISCEKSELKFKKNQMIELPIAITNNSNKSLKSFEPFPVHISYHWMNDRNEYEVFDGIRTLLPFPLTPQSKINLNINIMTPKKPGVYTLQLTAVQEKCFWFEDILNRLPYLIKVIIEE
jgi:2-polyprenyl-3-methyl-5-hydroxy-6-metoxy-1,4-benzoquinol methylase